MYVSNGLYIYFTTPLPFGKRFFLPPRGLVSEVFLRKFGLFLVTTSRLPRSLPPAARSATVCLVITFLVSPVVCGYGHDRISLVVSSPRFARRTAAVRIVSYRIVCIRIRVRVRVRVRMAPRSARRTGAGGMLYVVNTTLFR